MLFFLNELLHSPIHLQTKLVNVLLVYVYTILVFIISHYRKINNRGNKNSMIFLFRQTKVKVSKSSEVTS